MKRLLPSPLLSVALFLLWLTLEQSVSPGTILVGLASAIFWPAATAGLRPVPIRVRRPVVMLRLFAHVVFDMLRSNVEVAGIILAGGKRNRHAAFLEVPLELKDPTALAVIAVIVTFTPGTAWVELSADRRLLLMHVLAVSDEAAMVQVIKHRYERPLMEIFE